MSWLSSYTWAGQAYRNDDYFNRAVYRLLRDTAKRKLVLYTAIRG
jgi:hypothetical protein